MASIRRRIREIGHCTCLILAVLLALLPGVADAQPEAAVSAVGEESGTLGFAEALELTMSLDPAIRIASQRASLQRGVADEARGLFDLSMGLFTGYEYSEGELLASQIKGEVDRRNLHRDLATDFARIADDLERQLDEGKLAAPDCDTIIVVNGINVCSNEIDKIGRDTFDRLLSQLVEDDRDPVLRDVLRDLQEHLSTENERLNRIIIDVFRSIVPGQLQSLERLGEIPELEERSFLQLDLRLSKTFRSGISLGAGLVLEGEEDNFDGKLLLADFGGKGIPNTYTSLVGVGVEVPLGKGWGTVSTGAPERAAILGYEASILEAAHTASLSLLRTQLAYWDVVAAQERLKLLEETLEMQQGLHETVLALVEADEVASAELARVEARVASAERQVSAALQNLVSTRVRLAEAIGLEVEKLADAPMASDGFPDILDPAELESRLSDLTLPEALLRRNDLRAAMKRQEAAEVLLRAAERDLRRRFDLSFTVGYGGLYESFEDSVWDPGAYGETLSNDYAGPSVRIALNVDAPFANRVARGELDQSLALSRQSGINSTNLERRIGIRVEELTGSVRTAAEEVRQRSVAVSMQDRTLRDTEERFLSGEASVINTVLTEEQLTAARLQENAARRALAALTSELKFEVGRLATLEAEEGQILPDIDPSL